MRMTFMRSAGALAIAAGIAISAPAATLFHDDFQAADLGDTWFLGHDGGGGAGPTVRQGPAPPRQGAQ